MQSGTTDEISPEGQKYSKIVIHPHDIYYQTTLVKGLQVVCRRVEHTLEVKCNADHP